LEQDGFVARAFAVPECAHGLGGFVVEAGEHFVQIGSAEGDHEPFAGGVDVLDLWMFLGGEGGRKKVGRKETYMYGPGRSFMALKQRHVSSTRTGPWTYHNPDCQFL
jgi:hypothetical protein